MYMDDIFSGADPLSSTLEPQNPLTEILKIGGMILHKWCNDAPELCQTNDKVYPFCDAHESKSLDVLWKSKTDCLNFKIKFIMK